jgi:ABC-type proline/glycine betaine transport system ATPase subunit
VGLCPRLNREGVTIVLTTHYLEEAEQLCDRIAIINHGRLIANETTRSLVGMAQEKAVEVTVDRDLTAAPVAPCFDKIELKAPRTLAITYRKDRVNAGEVLARCSARARHRRRVDARGRPRGRVPQPDAGGDAGNPRRERASRSARRVVDERPQISTSDHRLGRGGATAR